MWSLSWKLELDCPLSVNDAIGFSFNLLLGYNFY